MNNIALHIKRIFFLLKTTNFSQSLSLHRSKLQLYQVEYTQFFCIFLIKINSCSARKITLHLQDIVKWIFFKLKYRSRSTLIRTKSNIILSIDALRLCLQNTRLVTFFWNIYINSRASKPVWSALLSHCIELKKPNVHVDRCQVVICLHQVMRTHLLVICQSQLFVHRSSSFSFVVTLNQSLEVSAISKSILTFLQNIH